MRSTIWRDIGELLRSTRLAGPLPVLGHLTEYVAAFEQTVTPVIERSGAPRCYGDALCDGCVKLCLMLAAYAATAGVPFRADLAVLGGAVARVYDDLVDVTGAEDAGGRTAALFDGNVTEPRSRQEILLHELYLELERRLDRDRADPIYPALRNLHTYQIRSRRQLDPAIGSRMLAEITLAKGGYAMVVLAGLVHPAMTDGQVDVVWQLGGALQLLDDYVDTDVDRRAGITTVATRGQLTLPGIRRRILAIRPGLRACFGRDQPLSGLLYLHLWAAFLKRRTPRWPAHYRPFRLVVRVLRRRYWQPTE